MLKFPPIIRSAYLLLTEACPFDCEYCYVKDRRTNNEMPFEYLEILKKAFTCTMKPTIIFFGGEPLLKIGLMKRIVEKYKDDFVFQVVTNGSVNLHQFVEEIYKPYKDIFDVQLSWDGNEDTRKMVSGKPSNSMVYENLIKELENGGAFEGRCVLDNTSVYSFYKTYKTFQELREKYRFSGDFTIVHQTSFDESYATVLGQQLEMIYNDAAQQLTTNHFFLPRLLLKNIVNMLQGIKALSCDVGSYIVVRPNGDIYPCTILAQVDERFKMGNLCENFDSEIVYNLRIGSSCKKDCNFKSLCDGGCRYERIKTFPNDWECTICEHSCKIYEEMYKRTQAFLDCLNEQQLEMLYQYLTEYNLWEIDYSNGWSNRNKRLLK